MTKAPVDLYPVTPGTAPEGYRHFIGASDGGVFQDTAWLSTWFATLPGDARSLTAHLPDYGVACVLGQAPRGHPERRPWLIGPRRYWFNDSGHTGFDDIYPEYNVFHGAGDDTVRAKALMALVTGVSDLEELAVRNARPCLTDAARVAAQALDWEFRIVRQQSTWRIYLSDVRAQSGSYLSTRSASFRAKTRRTERYFKSHGAPILHRADTDAQRASAFELLIDLNERVWARRGKPGAFTDQHVRAFHEKLIADFPDAIDLLTIMAGDRAIGVLYNLCAGGVAANYQSGFFYDPADNKMSPGYVSHALAVDHYAVRGFNTYDMLAGGDHYKERFAEKSETLTTFTMTRPTWRAFTLRQARRLRQFRPGQGRRQT